MKATKGKNKVFVYGILKEAAVADDPPDAVRGCLYESGIAFARFDEDGIVRGQVREIDDQTLAQWDRIEGVAHNFYSRIRVTTLGGISCWAYQYEGDVARAEVVEDGVWRGGRYS